MLFLNALLGLGTALAPVLVAVFVGLGIWWGLPLLVAVLLRSCSSQPAAALLARVERRPRPGASRARGLPARFWVFAAFALLYGVVETMNGNWATIYMTTDLGATAPWPRWR